MEIYYLFYAFITTAKIMYSSRSFIRGIRKHLFQKKNMEKGQNICSLSER